MKTPRSLAIAIVLAAMISPACSNGTDTTQIESLLDAQGRGQDALRDRMDALAIELSDLRLATTGQTDELSSNFSDRLDTLETQLTDLRADLDTLTTQQIDDLATTNAALSDLEASVTDLAATMDAVERALGETTRQLQDLREEHELLRAQFDQHLSNHS